MADYDITQLTECMYFDDHYRSLNLYPSISDNGSRVVYASAFDPDRPGHCVYLYDRNNHLTPQRLSINIEGDDRIFGSSFPQISGDGSKIIFAAQFYYTEERRTGIYIYDIPSETIRLIVSDRIPHVETGNANIGRPGMRKHVGSRPTISADGQRIAYIWSDYEYCGATSDHWKITRQRLLFAEITDEAIRGGTVLEIDAENTFGHGIKSLKISGNGQFITFYAGGQIDGLEVSNIEMPPYESETHSEFVGPTCNVYCYVVHILRPGQYSLQVAPNPDTPESPLIVSHPQTHNVQSFNTSVILSNPPSISSNGSKIALNAGVVMGAENTGIYVFSPLESEPHTETIIKFDATPGSTIPEEEVLITGVTPAISPDGNWLAYYIRNVSFPEGYSNPELREDDRTYCPTILKDEIQIRQLSGDDISDLLYPVEHRSSCIPYVSTMGIALSQDANHIVFITTVDKNGRNPDESHEVYYASKSFMKHCRFFKWTRNILFRKYKKFHVRL
jgi:hypothetical protein